MITLAIGTEKGGTGKTTTAAALGAELAASGYRVLLLDADPQASLTQNLGKSGEGRGLAEVIGGTTPGSLQLADIIQPISKGLDLAPADIALAGCELGLVQRSARESVLRSALAKAPYDVCLIDCPPSLGLLTIAALTAARGVIVPTLPSATDLRGLRLFLQSIAQVKQVLNPALELIGIVLVQYDPRLIAHGQALENIRTNGLEVLAMVPRSVRVLEAAAAGQPITVYDANSRPALAYHELCGKVIKWLKRNPR